MFANPWEGGKKKRCRGRNFDSFSKITATSPIPQALSNVTLPPHRQEVESTWSPWIFMGLWPHGPVEYGESEVGSALSWPGGFCFLPLETLPLEMLPLRTQPPCCETPKPPAETRRGHSSWQPALPANMWESHLGYPAHSSFQMPAASAAIWAWAAPSKTHPAEPIQPEETWKMINGCFKPLDFGEVCYVAIDNHIPPSSK